MNGHVTNYSDLFIRKHFTNYQTLASGANTTVTLSVDNAWQSQSSNGTITQSTTRPAIVDKFKDYSAYSPFGVRVINTGHNTFSPSLISTRTDSYEYPRVRVKNTGSSSGTYELSFYTTYIRNGDIHITIQLGALNDTHNHVNHTNNYNYLPMNDVIGFSTYQQDTGVSVSGGKDKSFTIPLSIFRTVGPRPIIYPYGYAIEDYYVPIAITHYTSGKSSLVVYRVSNVTSESVNLRVRNVTSSAVTSDAYVVVMWARKEFVDDE